MSRTCGLCYWRHATYAEACKDTDIDQECVFFPSRWRPAKLRGAAKRKTEPRGGA